MVSDLPPKQPPTRAEDKARQVCGSCLGGSTGTPVLCPLGPSNCRRQTKRWEADGRARGRLKIRRVGEDNQNKRHWFMGSTSG